MSLGERAILFHGDVTFILESQIRSVVKPFLDGMFVKGLLSRYETPDGGYEAIPSKPGIRRFVWGDFPSHSHRLPFSTQTIISR
jgi:hypothetical protein